MPLDTTEPGMSRPHALDFDTLCTHAGAGRDDGEPLVTPIVQSTTYCRDGLASRAEHSYSRQSNPTVAALETALGDLEDAPPAVCFGTGLGAETALFLALLKHGDHVVCSRAVYGGTVRLLQRVLAGLGVAADFVDTTDLDAVARTIRPDTRLVFIETPANPTLDVSDLRAIGEFARGANARLAVDNTFLTPVLQQPLELGADVSVYSTTKLIEGHSTALGGALIARDAALLDELRFVRLCIGGIQNPFDAWLTLQGLKTLPIRLERQCATARHVAERLAANPAVTTVHYPSLESSPGRDLAASQHRGAHGAVVSFEVEGGAAPARRLLREVELCRVVEHVGSVETLITHSATMTHAAVPPEQRAAVGVTDGLVRLSVGLEDPAAILADLETAIVRSTALAAEETSCPAVA